jgi:hypothetical protein
MSNERYNKKRNATPSMTSLPDDESVINKVLILFIGTCVYFIFLVNKKFFIELILEYLKLKSGNQFY